MNTSSNILSIGISITLFNSFKLNSLLKAFPKSIHHEMLGKLNYNLYSKNLRLKQRTNCNLKRKIRDKIKNIKKFFKQVDKYFQYLLTFFKLSITLNRAAQSIRLLTKLLKIIKFSWESITKLSSIKAKLKVQNWSAKMLSKSINLNYNSIVPKTTLKESSKFYCL